MKLPVKRSSGALPGLSHSGLGGAEGCNLWAVWSTLGARNFSSVGLCHAPKHRPATHKKNPSGTQGSFGTKLGIDFRKSKCVPSFTVLETDA